MRMARDSDDAFEWHTPTSPRDAVELIYFNFICGGLISLLWIGLAFFLYVVQNVRSCCGVRQPHHIDKARNARRLKKITPKPLPLQRKRALTLPLPSPPTTTFWKIKQRTDAQQDSSLLSKLPLEIRQLVYQEVIFGEAQGKVFHVYTRWRKLNSWQCTQPSKGQPCVWRTLCTLPVPGSACRDPNYLQNNEHPVANDIFVSMLRTCRQIYSEMIPIIYTAQFHFPRSKDFIDFSRTILSRRLNSIKHINMYWTGLDAYTLPSHWNQLWEILSRMEGLQELQILAVVPSTSNIEQIKNIASGLTSMKKIEGLRLFELLVPESQFHFWDDTLRSEPQMKLVSMPGS